ncbi:hypothetical protein FB382_002125 [Nocardioides ginsengisegetis]|uniref:Arylsulfotransferase (ASST) n=1 Tax=Nocardioides ginsengisegetis TaxID=661491 RepID=A0A7W3P9V7_9ACTN|nr:aryl-sulfate sulfotransferase [Nocardioides ginsengisegetis]MBA8803834.1 hypothetical protein [Nocardioides ginsengisegetis]
MQWRPGVLVAAVAVTALELLALTAPTQAADAPAHSVTIEGAGVSTWPSYDAGIDRYAVHTDDTTDGALTVTAGTTDLDGTVTVNGIPATNGQPLTLTDLVPGDEVAVAIADSAGTSHQSWIYLPPGFPTITSAGTGSAGHVLVGLSSFLSTHSFQTVLDDNGVPTYVREAPEPNDFTAHAHGPAYTVFEPVKDSPEDTEYGYRVLELDDQLQTTGTRRLDPVPSMGILADDTDFHDVEYLPDGRVILVGYHREYYEPGHVPWLDAVIQVQDAAGAALFTWTTKSHTDPSEGYVWGGKGQDYAHINSVEMEPNGDLLASFRNLGQVMRIATTAHDGFAPGDVIWRMGGKRNDFTFLDDPYAGFCAQHDARILPDGHLTLFDNGSRKDTTGPVAPQTADMCPDPANPGARKARPQTRVVEYALDEVNHTARLVRSFVPTGRYAPFAGNAQRLDDGTTLVGWSASQDSTGATPPFVSEVPQAGPESWSLTAPGWFSYRAFRAPAPDKQAPEITINGVEDGQHYVGQDLMISYTCTDRGGSTLQSCEGSVPNGATIGSGSTRSVTVTATDGAGNTTTKTVSWTCCVVSDPAWTPDLKIRKPGGAWTDRGVKLRLHDAGDEAVLKVRLKNRSSTYAYPVAAGAGNDAFTVRYFHGGHDITRRLVRGDVTTPELDQGEIWNLRLVVHRTRAAAKGDKIIAVVYAEGGGLSGGDQVYALVRAR